MAEISHFRYRYFGRKRYGNPLIVTLKARNSEIDLYTPISALVPVEVPVEVEIGDQI